MMYLWFIASAACAYVAYRTFTVSSMPVLGVAFVVAAVLLLGKSISASKKADEQKAAEQAVQAQTEAEQTSEQEQRKPRTVVRRYKDVHVAGVTFRNEDGESRQGVLRKIEAEMPPFDDIVLYDTELGEYEGKPSIAVLAEDVQVGFLPAYLAEDLAPVFEHVELENARVIGGGYNDEGERISYGMMVDVVVYED